MQCAYMVPARDEEKMTLHLQEQPVEAQNEGRHKLQRRARQRGQQSARRALAAPRVISTRERLQPQPHPMTQQRGFGAAATRTAASGGRGGGGINQQAQLAQKWAKVLAALRAEPGRIQGTTAAVTKPSTTATTFRAEEALHVEKSAHTHDRASSVGSGSSVQEAKSAHERR